MLVNAYGSDMLGSVVPYKVNIFGKMLDANIHVTAIFANAFVCTAFRVRIRSYKLLMLIEIRLLPTIFTTPVQRHVLHRRWR